MTSSSPVMPQPDASPDAAIAAVLASSAGYEIVATPGWAWVYDRRTRGPAIAAAVSGGITFIVGMNALIFVILALAGQPIAPWPVLAVELGLAALAGGICRAALKLRRDRSEAPREQLSPLVQLDRHHGMVLDGRGQALAPAAQVQAYRAMRIDSSAPSLMIRFPDNRRMEVARGSLFGGGLESAKGALRELGFLVQ